MSLTKTSKFLPFEDSAYCDRTPMFAKVKNVSERDADFIKETKEERKKIFLRFNEAKRIYKSDYNPKIKDIKGKILYIYDIGNGTIIKKNFYGHDGMDFPCKYNGREIFYSYKTTKFKSPPTNRLSTSIIKNDLLIFRFYVWKPTYFKLGEKRGFYELFRIIFDKKGEIWWETRDKIDFCSIDKLNTSYNSWIYNFEYPEELQTKEYFFDKETYECLTDNYIGFLSFDFKSTINYIKKSYYKTRVYKNTPVDIVENLNNPCEKPEPYYSGFVSAERYNNYLVLHVYLCAKEIIEVERFYISKTKIYKFGYNPFIKQFVSTRKNNLKIFEYPNKIINGHEIPELAELINNIGNPIHYLIFCKKYPIIEQLYNLKFYSAIANLENLNRYLGKYFQNAIAELNWLHNKSIKKALKTKSLKSINSLISLDALSVVANLADTNADLETRIKIAEKGIRNHELLLIKKAFKLHNKNPMPFLKSLFEKKNSIDLLELYVDFLKFAFEYNSLVSEKEKVNLILKPSEIEYEHNLISYKLMLLKEENNFVQYEKPFKRVRNSEEYKNLLFEDKEFSIIPVESYGDLKYEGNVLSHCVANYYVNMAQKETFIYFLRKKTNLEKPFMTIEIRDKNETLTLYQCKGLRNNNTVSKECKNFIEKWKKLKNISKDLEQNSLETENIHNNIDYINNIHKNYKKRGTIYNPVYKYNQFDNFENWDVLPFDY